MATHPVPVENELLTPREAATLLRLHPQTLATLRVTGRGPRFITATRRVLYRRAEIERWLSDHERASTSDVGEAAATM